ncbi:MAG: excinuclease ABC subunit C [Rikenellaceae bacterium]|nr:excinuclease ABC subunit C [Rikenellaceae bacterium]
MLKNDKKSIKEQVAMLPMSPGCYLFENSKGDVIYVGKAKYLRNRVRSYFVENRDHSAKVRVMVRQIAAMRHIVVDSETDALLLENSLIKTLQPRYNILLKDDKSYPWIAVTAETFPRILSTRQVVRDGSQYYGPYGSISAQRAVLDFLREALPLRSCRQKMTEASIAASKHTACLQFHLGNCKAPCIGKCSREEYRGYIDIATAVLKGDLRPVRNYLEGEMMQAAEELRFEVAARYKARLDALERYASRSVIVSAKMGDMDIFSLLVDDDEAYCNFLRVRNGSITAVHTATIAVGVESTEQDIMTLGIQHIKENIAGELARDVLVSVMPHEELFEGVKFTVPKRGEKHDLLAFSLRSAKTTRAERLKNLEIHNPARHTDRLMEAMRRELRLEKEPRHIECFDNSNLQGTNPVASCVVFRDGKPSRKEYRHFNIKTVVGADDFASMREILTRRYTRLLEEGAELPDLIVVDGGKGQLSSAYAILQELGIAERVPIVGLAKRLEEVFYPNDPMPYYLSRTGEPLKVICHIRDEAHRFGITHHRNRRSKNFIKTGLEGIEGVGEKSITALLRHFRTLSKLRVASVEEIAEIVGKARAQKVKAHLEKEKANG